MTYCIVPRDLARLHETLRRHFRDDPSIEVIVEQRARERRAARERRSGAKGDVPLERRKVHGAGGRRAGERRASLVEVEPRPLPRRAQRHAGRLAFVARLEPGTQELEDLDTARLVARFQAGDRDAFATLYMRYFDRTYAYLKIAFDDPHEAEDATQQVFMKALEALPGYERRRQPFRAWLFTIIRNYSLDELKKLRRVGVEDPFELSRRRERSGGEEPDLDVLTWISDRDLVLFVERLPPVQRQVLILRYMLDLGNREVAAALDRSPDEVKVLHYRAVRFLKERLTAIGRGPGDRGGARMRRRFRQAGVLRARRWVLR